MINVGWISTRCRLRVLVFFAILAICAAVFAVGSAGIAVATPNTEQTTDRVGPSQFDTNESDVLWESDLDLRTDRAPTVVDGILVVASGDHGSSDRVVAYDVGTGEQRWETDISARGSPTVVDGTVYVSGSDGVWALDLKLGTIEWHVESDEDTFSSGAQSVGDGSVYVSWSDSASGQVLSLDAETGDENWAIETNKPVRAGPTFIDGTVYFVTSDGMTAVDAADGDEQWTWDEIGTLEDRGSATEPTVADGLVYFSYTQGLESTTADYELFTVAIDEETGEKEWEVEFDDPEPALLQTATAPIVSGDGDESTVYVGMDGLYALNATDGSERWSDDDRVADPPTIADGTLFVPQTTDSEAFRALDPNDGSELWSVETGDRSDVIVVDGVAYVAVQTGDERIMAIDAGVSGSSSDSRVMLGGQNHHHEWNGEIPDTDPRVVDVEFDEGAFVEDELTVSATVRNDWDPTTSATYTLDLDGNNVVSKTIDVPAYGTNTVELPLTAPSESGEYTLGINGEEIGTLTVVDEDEPVFRSILPFFDTRLEGDLIQISYDATNLGDESVDPAATNDTLALEGPAFDGREDVAFSGDLGLNPGETRTKILVTDPIETPGEYTAYIEDKEIDTIEVLPTSDPIYLTDTNRLHDSIISGIEAPIEPSAAGKASVDVRYENLGESQDSVESELVAYDEGTEVASVTEAIEVDGESDTTERLSVPLAEEGVYDLEVDGQSVGEVEVLIDGVTEGESIQAAIDAALPGEEVVVGDGTYEESLTIDKPLTLRTVSEGGAVLDGSQEKFERAITVTDDDVTVEGFQIEGYTGSGNADSAVVAGGEQFTFVNNTITGSVDAVQTQSNEDAHGIVIADNHIYDNDGDAIAFANRVDDASVLRNTITDNGGDGLYLGNRNDRFTVDANEIRRNEAGIAYTQQDRGGSDGSVTNNTVTDNAGAGIDLGTSQVPDNVVEYNTVTGNENGITAGARAEVRHNHVTAPDGGGIEVQGASVVANNTIEDVGFVGIDPQGGTEIKYNELTDVSIGISSERDNLEIHGNEFTGTETDLRLDNALNAKITDNEFATGIILVDVPDTLDEEPHEMSGNTVGGDPLVYAVDEDDPTIDADAGQVILLDVTNANLDGLSVSDVTAGIQVTHSEQISITDSEFTDISGASPTVGEDVAGVVSTWYSSGVTIDEFEITGSNRGVYVADSDGVTITNGSVIDGSPAINIDGENSDVVIEYNEILEGQGSLGTVISVSQADGLSITENDIRDGSLGITLNRATDATVADNVIEDSSTGVRFGHQAAGISADIGDFTFTNNTVTGSDRDGVIVDRGSLTENVTVTDNVVTNSGLIDSPSVDPVGLDLAIDGETVTVANNFIADNEGDIGSRLDIEGESVTVSDNVVADNDVDTGFDIHLDTTDGTVVSNTVRNNGDGLVVTGESAIDGVDVTITENVIEDNEGMGLTVGGFYESFLVTENSIAGNGDGLFHNPGDDYILDAKNNWWGATDGPSGGVIDNETGEEADGSGDSITIRDVWWLDDDSVKFEPWLEAPIVDTGTLSGTVTDADTGDPIADATVEVLDGSVVVNETTTDASGNYEFTLAVGTYDVAASTDDYEESVNADVEITEDEATTSNLSLSLLQSGTIEGTVADTDSDPVADAEVEIVEQEDVGQPPAVDGFTTTVETDADGQFEAEVPPGVYQYTITSPGLDDVVEQDIEVNSGEQIDLGTVEMTSVPVVTGVVTNTVTDEPIQGVTIESSSLGASEPFDTAVTNATGEYVINVPDETTQLDFNSPGYITEEVFVDGQEIDGTEQIDVELTREDDLGTVTGTVTRESTDETVQGVIVWATDGDVQVDVDSTGPDGMYELEVEPGTYTIEAMEESGPGVPESGTVEDVEVSAGDQTTADIELTPSDLTPASNVSVSINETESVLDVTEGEMITVVADITNTGDDQTEQDVALGVLFDSADDDLLYEADPQSVTVGSNETESVSFSFESELAFDGADAVVVSGEPGETEPTDTDSIQLSVSETDGDPALESITLSIDETTLIEGETTLPTLIATFDDGSTTDITEDAAFTSDNTTIVSTDGSTLTAESPGTAMVTATYEGETDTVEMTVEADEQPEPDPELELIALSIDETTLIEGSATPATVTATFDDGTIEDVTDEASPDSDNTTVVSVDGSTLTAESPGTATVTATYEDETDSLEVTVESDQPEPEPDLEVLEATVVPTQLETGEETTVNATVENVGDGDGELTVPLEISGLEVENTTVTLDAGESTDVTFTRTFESAGEFQISVGGVEAGTISVIDDPDADIFIYGADVNQSAILLGDTVSVTGDLLNNGGTGTYDVDLNVDGERVETKSVEVGPGAMPGAVDFEWTPTEADLPAGEDEMNATISLNGFVVETVFVENQYFDIQVIAASTSEIELIEGEHASVVGSIYQAGNVEGTEEISLNATHQETGETESIGSQEVTLSPGFYHLGAINITFEPDEAGTYDLELGDRDAGTVEVESAESDIQVIAASTSEIELIEGEHAYVIGSIYQAGNIEGTEELSLNATHQETGETELIDTQEATLEPGFYHLGALNITFEPDEAGTYDLELGDRNAGTVEVEPAESNIQVIAGSTSEIELIEGEHAYVVGSIYQAGNVEGTEKISLNATHQETGETEVVGSQEVTLSPGFYHLGAINITFVPDEAGTYDLELGDRNAGTIDVEPAESDIQVIAASVADVEMLQTEETYVIGSIYQSGNVEGPQEIELNATHRGTNETHTVDTVEKELAPGFYHLGALNVTFEPEEAGTYDLELGDRNAGFVEVEPAEPDIQVIAASASEVEIIQGEEFSVTGSIYNSGDVEGTETIELTATHNETDETHVLGSQEVTAASNVSHLGAINITAEFDEPGYYDLELGDRDAGLMAVEEAITDITVIAASTEDIELIEGEETYVIGSVYQGGNVEETEEISLNATHQETGETEVIGSQEVTLAPGFYHLGALNITFEPNEAGTYDLELGDRDAGTVDVEPAESDIQVIAASQSATELIEGEDTYVVGSVYQAGNIEGTEEIALNATHQETGETEVIGSQEVTLAPGFYHLGAINITAEFNQAGMYDLELGDTYAGSVDVEPAESDIQVIAGSTSEIELIEGEHAYVVGSIYQAGNVEGTEEISLNATHQETGETELIDTQEVTLAPGFYHLGAINITFEPDEAGTYDLELGDTYAGTVDVEPSESDIQVIAASTSQIELIEGEHAYVVGSVYQGGNVEGTEEISLNATHKETGETEAIGSQEVTLAPGFYHLGAINITAEFDQAGTYELELGDRSAGTIDVAESTVEASIVDVAGHSVNFDSDTGSEQVYASEDVPVTIEIDADLDLETVTVLASSLDTNYVRSFEASHDDGETWTATVSLADIQDDGRYEVSVVAVDRVGSAGTDIADNPLVIDRDAPRLSATLEDVDSEGATVVVESDKPLAEPPEVEGVFTAPDNSTESGSVSMLPVSGSDTHFTGTFATGETGTYEITSVGTDRAGNEGSDNASVTVDTRFTLGDGVIEIDGTGTAIEFDVADDTDEAVLTQDLFASLSETTANANLDDGQLGAGFITADLDNLLDYYLEEGTVESASISMAIDEDDLDGASVDDVELQYYDDTSGSWTTDPVIDSSVEYDGSDPFLTASVTGFSTYGAFVPDTEPPEITVDTPVDGQVFDAGTETVQLRIEYEDALTDVNSSSVRLEIDGVDRTDHENTSITSSAVEHTLSVEDGTTYDVRLSVADDADNKATHELSFEVDSPSTGSSSGGSGSSTPAPDDDTSAADDDKASVPDDDDGSVADDGKPVSDDDSASDGDEVESDDGSVADDDGDTPIDTDDESAVDDDSDSVPGFGSGIAVLAILLAVALVSRHSVSRL